MTFKKETGLCLVAQVDVPPKDYNFERLRNEELIADSKASVKQYAKKIGAEYKLITETTDHPWFARFDLFTESEYDKYDKILYLDYDVIINRSKNIFKECTLDTFCVAKRPPNQTNDLKTGKFNSGVLCFGRNARGHFAKWDRERANQFRYRDQPELNLLAEDYKNVKWLSYKWNDYTFGSNSFFHHYKGKEGLNYVSSKYL